MAKKMKNPFKMKGGYIGALVGWISLLILPLGYFNFFFLTIWQNVLGLPSVGYSAILLVVIIGFLIGWFSETKIFN